MRLTSQSAPLLSRILNCWDLSTTPQPRYTLRHEQNSNSILSRVDIVKIFIHCKNIRGCRVSCLLEHNWGAAACGLLLLLGCGEILIYLIANVATDTVTSRGRPALYHHLTLPQLRNPPQITSSIFSYIYKTADKAWITSIVSYTMIVPITKNRLTYFKHGPDNGPTIINYHLMKVDFSQVCCRSKLSFY